VKGTVTLRNGSVVRDVFIADGTVVKAGEYPVPPGGAFKPIPFGSDEIADVEDGS
jgi:transcriptional regulator of NAD metabolism